EPWIRLGDNLGKPGPMFQVPVDEEEFLTACAEGFIAIYCSSQLAADTVQCNNRPEVKAIPFVRSTSEVLPFQSVPSADRAQEVDPDFTASERVMLMADVDANPEEVPKGSAPPQRPAGDSNLESNASSGCLFFSSLPRRRKKAASTAVETTQLYMDRSAQLEEMIQKDYAGNEFGVLGELQLAYIAFLLGQNYDGFEQWRALLQLLCGCESAVERRTELYAELCRCFFAQLNQAPADLFGDDLTKDNFMGTCALQLLELCDSEASPQKLRRRCSKLRELVLEKFGLSAEDLGLLGEDAPLIVEEATWPSRLTTTTKQQQQQNNNNNNNNNNKEQQQQQQ
ncbi:unnamed protein product, partial [Polarella glacialis]